MATSSESEALALVDRFYEAALHPEAWTEALKRLGSAFGAEGTVLEVHERGAVPQLWSSEMPEDGLRLYGEHYHRVCPRLAPMMATPGRVYVDPMSEREMDRSEFFVDFLRPFGLRYFGGGCFLRADARHGIIGIHRAPRTGPLDRHEIDAMARLLPHIQRSVELHDAGTGAQARGTALEAALEVVDAGVLLLDRRKRVVHANGRARALMARGGALRSGTGSAVLAADPRCRAGLDASVDAALELALGRRSEPAPPCVLRTSDEARVSAITAPLLPVTRRSFLASHGARVLLVLRDTRSKPMRAAQPLLQLAYDLTPAESALAWALACGETVKAYCVGHGISHNTARTHLARMRSKLGVRTQAQVASRVWDLLPRSIGSRGSR